MKSYSSREVIKILESHGWYLKRVVGDHHQYTDGHKLATVRHVPGGKILEILKNKQGLNLLNPSLFP